MRHSGMSSVAESPVVSAVLSVGGMIGTNFIKEELLVSAAVEPGKCSSAGAVARGVRVYSC